MNINPLTIYLWQLADKILPILITFSVVFGVAGFILIIFHGIASADVEKYKARKAAEKNSDGYWDDNLAEAEVIVSWSTKWRLCVSASVISLLLSGMIPSSNTIAMMAIIPKIAESKAIQQDLPDLYDAAVKALKDQLQKK